MYWWLIALYSYVLLLPSCLLIDCSRELVWSDLIKVNIDVPELGSISFDLLWIIAMTVLLNAFTIFFLKKKLLRVSRNCWRRRLRFLDEKLHPFASAIEIKFAVLARSKATRASSKWEWLMMTVRVCDGIYNFYLDFQRGTMLCLFGILFAKVWLIFWIIHKSNLLSANFIRECWFRWNEERRLGS